MQRFETFLLTMFLVYLNNKILKNYVDKHYISQRLFNSF